MNRTIALRFRDLVVETGGTIRDHKAIIDTHGSVWWGWWAKQHEINPHTVFVNINENITREPSDKRHTIYLYDSGLYRIHRATLCEISDAPNGSRITTPNPEMTPAYYHRATCPTWFRLSSISEINFSSLHLRYESFPTRPELTTLTQLLGLKIASTEQMCNIDSTLLVVQEL